MGFKYNCFGNEQADRQTAIFIEGMNIYRMIMNVCCEDAGINREL